MMQLEGNRLVSILPTWNQVLVHANSPIGNGKLSTDHPMWGDLIWSYPGKGKYLNDDDRTIWGGGRIGVNGSGNHNS